VDVDSLSGEKMMSVAIDEVVISASNRRNLVERNGKINVEFVVSVPQELQARNWQLVVDPQLLKGADTLAFDPLVYSGDRFRTMQRREYARYDDYLGRIVDSADYFERFGDKRAYARYMDRVAEQRTKYADAEARLERMTPEEAMFDRQVGWTTRGERRRQYARLRRYVTATDRKVRERTSYTPDASDKFDHLNDYFAPRYRHAYTGDDVLPGGGIYTRVQGEYPVDGGREREAYIRSLTENPGRVYGEVYTADDAGIRTLAGRRLAYTGLRRPEVEGLLRETGDSAARENYRIRKEYAADRLAALNALDTAEVRRGMLREGELRRNYERAVNSPAAFARLVRHPYYADARLDTVICRPDGRIDYYYTEQVQADENTSKLYLCLAGEVEDRSGRTHRITRSDTLTYNVASMTTFLDETTRYMQRIVLRDAEANARFFFTFPSGKSTLVDTLTANRRQIAAVRSLTRGLMTDPVYIIDSITLRATASPEGTWQVNERLARERAARLRGAEFEQVFRFGEPHTVVKVREPLREIARFVRSLEVAEHRKGLRPVPLFDPADRLVGHQIGRESLFHRAAYALVVVHPVFGRLEYRVAVGALIVENAVIVESRWFLFQMPFADQRRPVAGLLQPLGDVVLFGTQCVVERVDAVQVAVLPGVGQRYGRRRSSRALRREGGGRIRRLCGPDRRSRPGTGFDARSGRPGGRLLQSHRPGAGTPSLLARENPAPPVGGSRIPAVRHGGMHGRFGR